MNKAAFLALLHAVGDDVQQVLTGTLPRETPVAHGGADVGKTLQGVPAQLELDIEVVGGLPVRHAVCGGVGGRRRCRLIRIGHTDDVSYEVVGDALGEPRLWDQADKREVLQVSDLKEISLVDVTGAAIGGDDDHIFPPCVYISNIRVVTSAVKDSGGELL